MINSDNKKSPHDILGTWGSELSNKKILLCVTGSISAYRSPDLARALIRHGAIVIPCMSNGAEKIIHPYALQWATGFEPLREITANMEHLTPLYEDIDLLLLAPATANVIGKIANGIADDIVSATLLTAIGMIDLLPPINRGDSLGTDKRRCHGAAKPRYPYPPHSM